MIETNLNLLAQSYLPAYVIVLILFTVAVAAVALQGRRRKSYKADMLEKKKKSRH